MGILNEHNTIKNPINENMEEKSKSMKQFQKPSLSPAEMWGSGFKSHGPGAGQRGVTTLSYYDQEGGRRCGERQPEICLLNWWKLRWDLFSSSKTTKRAVRRYVKQSRPTVSRDHSHAWQLFSALLGCLPRYSPPACVSNCLSSSSPSTSHNYSMTMKNGFSKMANTRSRDFTHEKKISGISGYYSVIKPAPKVASLIFTRRSWLEYFMPQWIYFSRFTQP